MRRVFKWRSPLSVGAWVLTGFGGAATAGAILLAWHRGGGGPPTWLVSVALGALGALGAAAMLGSVLATYTGVLVGATVELRRRGPAVAALRQGVPGGLFRGGGRATMAVHGR